LMRRGVFWAVPGGYLVLPSNYGGLCGASCKGEKERLHFYWEDVALLGGKEFEISGKSCAVVQGKFLSKGS